MNRRYVVKKVEGLEMAWVFRALVTLADSLRLIPCTQIVAQNHL